MIRHILEKVDRGEKLTREDAVCLLNTNNTGREFYELIGKANECSRKQYQNRGYIFAQIGLNAEPCSGNCKFCSLAKDHYAVQEISVKTLDEITAQVRMIDFSRLDSLFLMTTADYPFEKFLETGRAVKNMIPDETNMIANIGDFDDNMAKQIKAAGFNGVYHIVRLREGIDTDIPVEIRIQTLDAVKANGMELYYCIEPIGTEHTYEEIADEMIRARNYGVNVMAVMGRTSVPGSAFAHAEEVTELELTKIVAVARLVTNPRKSMNIHEPKFMPLLAGVNQLYAEMGVNPRDTNSSTEMNRGKGIADVEKMLLSANYIVRRL